MESDELKDKVLDLVREDIEFREELRKEINSDMRDKRVSRRDFLKGVGGGLLGIGAFSFMPSASSLELATDGNFSVLGNSGNTDISLGSNGELLTDEIGRSGNVVNDVHAERLNTSKIVDASTGNEYSVSSLTGSSLESTGSNVFGGTQYGFGESDASLEAAKTSLRSQSNEIYAKNFPGSGLASKVENALQWMKSNISGGILRITPKDDGSGWTWDKELTIVPEDFNGVQMVFDRNVKIDYPGNGTAITLNGGVNDNQSPVIEGGIWTFSGDPDGWLSIQDTYATLVSPASVNKCYNSNTDAFAVSIENHGTWSETTRIKECSLEADRAVQFLTADDTGGGGTDSFQETRIQHVTMKGKDYGLKTRGNMRYCKIENCTFRPQADGARCLVFDHRFMGGSMATALKFEDVVGYSNTTGIYEIGDTFYGPLIMEAAFYKIDQNWDGGGGLQNITADNLKGIEIQAPGGDISHNWRFNTSQTGNAAFELHNDGDVVKLENRNGELYAVNSSGGETQIT